MKEGKTRHEGSVSLIELHGALGVHLHAVELALLKGFVGLGIEVGCFFLLRHKFLEIRRVVDELGVA